MNESSSNGIIPASIPFQVFSPDDSGLMIKLNDNFSSLNAQFLELSEAVSSNPSTGGIRPEWRIFPITCSMFTGNPAPSHDIILAPNPDSLLILHTMVMHIARVAAAVGGSGGDFYHYHLIGTGSPLTSFDIDGLILDSAFFNYPGPNPAVITYTDPPLGIEVEASASGVHIDASNFQAGVLYVAVLVSLLALG